MMHTTRKAMLHGSSLAATMLATPAILHAPLMFTGPQANLLTGLMPHLWAGLEVVSRELVGLIPGVNRNASVERAALNQAVSYTITPQMRTHDNTPAMSVPEPEDHDQELGSVQITKSKNVNFGFVGEEQLALTAGLGAGALQAQYFASALRVLVNEVERDGMLAAYKKASRAWGTPGTVPFSNDKMTDAAQLKKILDDNGAPATGRSLVIDTSTGAKLREIYNLTRVNESGTTLTLRDGELLPLVGFSVRETGQSVQHDAGSAAGATTNTAGYAVGARVITLASAGTGDIKAGDVITFAGDTNKYVVESGDASVANGGTITLQKPGLRVAIPTSATAITVLADYSVNLGMSPDAMILMARAPAIPQEGDMAVDSFLLVDPRSGIAFDVRVYVGYKKVRYEVGLAWGWGVPNPEHLALLMG